MSKLKLISAYMQFSPTHIISVLYEDQEGKRKQHSETTNFSSIQLTSEIIQEFTTQNRKLEDYHIISIFTQVEYVEISTLLLTDNVGNLYHFINFDSQGEPSKVLQEFLKEVKNNAEWTVRGLEPDRISES